MKVNVKTFRMKVHKGMVKVETVRKHVEVTTGSTKVVSIVHA